MMSLVTCLHIYAFLHACHLATTISHQSAKFEANPLKKMSYSIFSAFAVLGNLKQNGCHGNSIHF